MTPVLLPLSDESSVSRYTPPDGFCVLFLQEDKGKIVIKCKKSDGSIQIVGSGAPDTDPTVEPSVDPVTAVVVVNAEPVVEASGDVTATFKEEEVEIQDDILILA